MGRIEVRAFENGKLTSSAVAHMWTAFLNGRWTRERPSRPGKYIIANCTGRVTGEVFVFFDEESRELTVHIRDGALCKIEELKDSNIWWWSKSMPQLMPLPAPGLYRNTPRKKPEAIAPPKGSAKEAEYRSARRRMLMAQIGLHEMPQWEDGK